MILTLNLFRFAMPLLPLGVVLKGPLFTYQLERVSSQLQKLISLID